jgi:hypothetical protein
VRVSWTSARAIAIHDFLDVLRVHVPAWQDDVVLDRTRNMNLAPTV